jgi:hypothetical protein
MAHFAKIENGIVTQVVVVDNQYEENGQEYLNSIGLEGTWLKTSFNTYGGKHSMGGVPLRKNYAGIGFTYDEQRDAFISPKPTDLERAYVLDEETCLWVEPE